MTTAGITTLLIVETGVPKVGPVWMNKDTKLSSLELLCNPNHVWIFSWLMISSSGVPCSGLSKRPNLLDKSLKPVLKFRSYTNPPHLYPRSDVALWQGFLHGEPKSYILRHEASSWFNLVSLTTNFRIYYILFCFWAFHFTFIRLACRPTTITFHIWSHLHLSEYIESAGLVVFLLWQ